MAKRRFFSVWTALFFSVLGCTPASPDSPASLSSAPSSAADPNGEQAARLGPPEDGTIPVALVISSGAAVIDFAGPWEVFQDVTVPGRGMLGGVTRPFRLFTVSASRDSIRVSGGLQIVPDYTFEDAPTPKVIVAPAQRGAPGLTEWLRSASAKADLTMSVCTGAFTLAEAGLLDGRSATTHHSSLNDLESQFPSIKVRRGVRYVEGPHIATAGGLTSGIDLALRVVERYYGHEVAQQTAVLMEHTSTGWHRDAGLWDASPGTPPSATRP